MANGPHGKTLFEQTLHRKKYILKSAKKVLIIHQRKQRMLEGDHKFGKWSHSSLPYDPAVPYSSKRNKNIYQHQ